jgi:hypothetical protein
VVVEVVAEELDARDGLECLVGVCKVAGGEDWGLANEGDNSTH